MEWCQGTLQICLGQKIWKKICMQGLSIVIFASVSIGAHHPVQHREAIFDWFLHQTRSLIVFSQATTQRSFPGTKFRRNNCVNKALRIFPTGVLHAHPGPNIIVAQNWHLVNAYLRFHYVLTTRLFLETCRNSGSKRCRRKKRRARRLCQFHMCAIICLRQLHKRSCFSTCAYAMCRNVLCWAIHGPYAHSGTFWHILAYAGTILIQIVNLNRR